MSVGRLATRAVVGGYFFAHGTQKLFGWFDGPGLDGATGFMRMLGIHPPRANAIAAATTEAGGGVALLAGAGTPFAVTALVSVMITAIRTAHWSNGPFNAQQGYEYNLVLIAALLALAETGPGAPSVDAARGDDHHGPGWAAFALAAGIAGAVGTKAVSAALAPTEDADADAPAPAETSPAS